MLIDPHIAPAVKLSIGKLEDPGQTARHPASSQAAEGLIRLS